MTIQRYDENMQLSETGAYVKYDDHEEIMEAIGAGGVGGRRITGGGKTEPMAVETVLTRGNLRFLYSAYLEEYCMLLVESNEIIRAIEQAVLQSDRIRNMQGMADCMEMVREEFIEADLIDVTTPPTMIADLVRAQIWALRKDAERYRWLRDTLHNAKAGGGVKVNDALQVYDTPVQGEEVCVYWYQDTPVGFYQSEATTLDGAIDEAMEQQT